MKAVVECGGKQYYVSVGDMIYVEKLEKEADEKIVFDNVLMAVDEKAGSVDSKDVKVEGKVIKQGKQKKIIVFKYKPKKKYRKKQGHRQPYTQIEITSIK